MKYFFQGFLVLSLVVLMGQGCNPFQRAQERAGEAILERTIESQTGGNVEIDVGGGASLPKNFPDDVPRYPGAEYVSALVTDEGKVAIANFKTEDSAHDVQAWFKSEIEANGYELDTVFEIGASLQLYRKGEAKISIQTQRNEDEGVTVVSIQKAE